MVIVSCSISVFHRWFLFILVMLHLRICWWHCSNYVYISLQWSGLCALLLLLLLRYSKQNQCYFRYTAWLKRPNFWFHVSPGSAETLARGRGITNHHLIAYSLSNISAKKNYQNRLMCVEFIVCYITVVFIELCNDIQGAPKNGTLRLKANIFISLFKTCDPISMIFTVRHNAKHVYTVVVSVCVCVCHTPVLYQNG